MFLRKRGQQSVHLPTGLRVESALLRPLVGGYDIWYFGHRIRLVTGGIAVCVIVRDIPGVTSGTVQVRPVLPPVGGTETTIAFPDGVICDMGDQKSPRTPVSERNRPPRSASSRAQ